MELICGYMLSIRKFYDNGFGYGWFFASFFCLNLYMYIYILFLSLQPYKLSLNHFCP